MNRPCQPLRLVALRQHWLFVQGLEVDAALPKRSRYCLARACQAHALLQHSDGHFMRLRLIQQLLVLLLHLLAQSWGDDLRAPFWNWLLLDAFCLNICFDTVSEERLRRAPIFRTPMPSAWSFRIIAPSSTLTCLKPAAGMAAGPRERKRAAQNKTTCPSNMAATLGKSMLKQCPSRYFKNQTP